MKKVATISLVFLMFILCSFANGNAFTNLPVHKGDINGDASVDLKDAILALKLLSGLNPLGIRSDYVSSGADVNNNGKIGFEETEYILQVLSGLRADPSSDTTPPTVSSTGPSNGAIGVSLNNIVIATFSEPINTLNITAATFTLKQGAIAVSGTVTYSGVTAVFTPTSNLLFSTVYTAKITTGVKDLAGNSLSTDYVWSFTTGLAPDNTVQTGHVSPLASGLLYQTNTQSGAVASDGTFLYLKGEQVSFGIGGFELANVRAGRDINLLPLESETASVNLLRLLKALDTDGNLDNGAQIPSTAIANLFAFDLNNEVTTSGAVYMLNPSRDLPLASDLQITSILGKIQSARINPAGTYTSFITSGTVDPITGSYYSSSACGTAIIYPKSGTVTLPSATQWGSTTFSGSAMLVMSDGTTAQLDLRSRVGTVTIKGVNMLYEVGPVKNGSTRAISLLTQNTQRDPCSQSLMFLRDKSQPNNPPIASLSGAMYIDLPTSKDEPFTYTFTSGIVPNPDVFNQGVKDIDGIVVSQRWTSSKGKSGTDSSFTETIGANESVTFTLTATDDEGASSTKTWIVGDIARTAEKAAAFVSKGGGLYGTSYSADTYRLYFKFDQANNMLYEFDCETAAEYCTQSIFNFDLTGSGLRGLLENMRFLIPGLFSWGDTPLQFHLVRDLPWGYTPGGQFLDVAIAPSLSLSSGAYQGSQTVQMSTSTSSAIIYYTLDGSTPTSASTRYTAPLTLSMSATVKAITIASGLKNSAISQAAYTITALPIAATPVFSLASGSYVGAQALQISSTTAGALIRYTTDGSKPTPDSAKYTGIISLQASINFRATTMASGFSDSATTAASYTITQPVPPPTPQVPKADCAAGNVVWQSGSAQCLGVYPGGKSGTSSSVIDSVGPVTGMATSSCTNGSVSTSGNCTAPVVPPPPPPARSGLVTTYAEYLAYDNLRCANFGSNATQFGVQVKNQTTGTVDIRVCPHRQIGYTDCYVYTDVKPGEVRPALTHFSDAGWGPADYECRSDGTYTIEWSTSTQMGFGRAKNGEAQLIEKEQMISPNAVPYDFNHAGTLPPSLSGCPPNGSIPCPKPVPVPVPQPSTAAPTPSAPPASQETPPDADGCYIPRRDPPCVVVEQTSMTGDGEFIVRYRNNCQDRVYIGFCNLKKDGSADCGADGIRQGGSISWWTYGAMPPGKYAYKYTGITNASMDWVCGDRDPVYKAQDPKRDLIGK